MFFKILVRAKGLEPSTSTLARLRSSQLSYARMRGYFDILFSIMQAFFYPLHFAQQFSIFSIIVDSFIGFELFNGKESLTQRPLNGASENVHTKPAFSVHLRTLQDVPNERQFGTKKVISL